MYVGIVGEPHPLFRLDGSSMPRRIASVLLATAGPTRSRCSGSGACGKSPSLTTTTLDLSPMRWADDPHQTAQPCRAPISVSACSSPATAMRRSLTLPLEHVSKSYRHKCVHVAHLGALNIRKNTSRQPVERHIRLTSSQSPTFSILRAIQNT